MALRNAVKVALISENEEPLLRDYFERPALRLEPRVPPPTPRPEERIAAPAPAVIAAPVSDTAPLADALLWWVKEQLWVSEPATAAPSEPTPPVEASATAIIVEPVTEPSSVDISPPMEGTPPQSIGAIEVEAVELPAPLEPEPVVETPAPAPIAESAADAPSAIDTPMMMEAPPPQPIDPLEVEAIGVPAPIDMPPAPAMVVPPLTDALPQLEPVVDPRPRDTENPADPWRARAAATRAMAATLPQRSTGLVIAKIAALYDELALESAGTAETAPVEMPRPRLPPDRYRAARH